MTDKQLIQNISQELSMALGRKVNAIQAKPGSYRNENGIVWLKDVDSDEKQTNQNLI